MHGIFQAQKRRKRIPNRSTCASLRNNKIMAHSGKKENFMKHEHKTHSLGTSFKNFIRPVAVRPVDWPLGNSQAITKQKGRVRECLLSPPACLWTGTSRLRPSNSDWTSTISSYTSQALTHELGWHCQIWSPACWPLLLGLGLHNSLRQFLILNIYVHVYMSVYPIDSIPVWDPEEYSKQYINKRDELKCSV